MFICYFESGELTMISSFHTASSKAAFNCLNRLLVMRFTTKPRKLDTPGAYLCADVGSRLVFVRI